MLLVRMVIATILAIVTMLANTIIVIYMERKILADIHMRMGPREVGKFGLLQPFADAIKLLTKEDIVPEKVDKWLYVLAPFIVFVPSFMLYMAIPLTDKLVVNPLEIGVFYIFAIASIFPVGIIIAGWSSFNKYSLLGGLRAAAQQISYEVPMLLSILGAIMIAGSLSLVKIVEAQAGTIFGIIPRWFIFFQPFGFLFYLITGLAELNRVPFDIPEAESELVSGYMTEYGGVRFLFFMLSEYSNMFVVSALAALIFLGGWNGPILPPIIWFFIKTYSMVFLMIWLRGTLPRMRVDQLMGLGWKVIMPLALVNIMITGLLLI